MKAAAALAFVLGLFAACDPSAALCSASIQYHHDRCFQAGDQASCDWIAEHAGPSLQCL